TVSGHSLREFISVRLGLVRAHVRIERALQRETGARSGWVVVNVHHLNFDPKQLQWVLQEHFHIELAAGALPADLLPVNFLVNEQDAVLQVHLQVRRPRVGYHLEATGSQLGEVQPQVLCDIPHQSAMVRLLRDRVAYLREHAGPTGLMHTNVVICMQ
uniref:Uncharacterized protein n=1 Tax=Amphiprion ocellaris TaxID=80972 RepID=A0A3Q1BTC9_AMPOC